MSEHTKEPWSADNCYRLNGNAGWKVSNSDGVIVMSGRIKNEHDARRIVACVNACQEIPTDLLEREKHVGTAAYRLRRDAEQQRDELLEALKSLSAMYARTWDRVDGALVMLPDGIKRFEDAHEKARIAIAKCEAKP